MGMKGTKEDERACRATGRYGTRCEYIGTVGFKDMGILSKLGSEKKKRLVSVERCGETGRVCKC